MSGKKHYRVYRIVTQYYDCIPRTHKSEIGDTWAVSEKQAINNIKFRYGIKPRDLYCDRGGDSYSRETDFEAELIK